jgi:Tfp pilus assembly protein PilZ
VADTRNLKRHRKRMTLKFGNGEAHRVAFTEDISRQGMCIKTAFVYPPGSSIKVELTLPDGTLVKLEGLVVWAKKVPPNMIHLIKKCGMGVKFTRIEAGEEAFAGLCGELSTDDRPALFVGDDLHGDPPLPRAIELTEIDRLPGAEKGLAALDQQSLGGADDG